MPKYPAHHRITVGKMSAGDRILVRERADESHHVRHTPDREPISTGKTRREVYGDTGYFADQDILETLPPGVYTVDEIVSAMHQLTHSSRSQRTYWLTITDDAGEQHLVSSSPPMRWNRLDR